jgi:hypothetical protein
MAISKLIHSMILSKIAHVTDESHKSQVQNNSFIMTKLQMNLREIFKDVSDEVQIVSTWLFTNWHWPSPLA